MKKNYALPLITAIFMSLLTGLSVTAQTCTPQGNQTSYGTNNVWIGYVYQGTNFNTYKGYVNAGTAASSAIDVDFGGAGVTYATNGCSVFTDGFSVRYRLRDVLNGNFTFTVGGNDGYRLSLDGGTTWVINNWTNHAYTTTAVTLDLNGMKNLVLEYYEDLGENRVTFNMVENCVGNGNTAVYGNGNVWRAYLYQGTNFDIYKGFVTRGAAASANFDENWGGNNVSVATSACPVQTELFSVRFRTHTVFTTGTYIFSVGGNDGYRLSLDGGATWVINNWVNQPYTTASYTAIMNGGYDIVLEYYGSNGANRINYTVSTAATLPVKLTSFTTQVIAGNQVQLNWTTAAAINFDHYNVQTSTDGITFRNLQTVAAQTANSSVTQSYSYTDVKPAAAVIYYRLAMVDIDGTINYSSIKNVSFKTAGGIKLYPTVVENGVLYLENDQRINQGKVQLISMNGQVLQTLESALSAGRQPITLKQGTTAGSYMILVSDGANILAKKMIIIK